LEVVASGEEKEKGRKATEKEMKLFAADGMHYERGSTRITVFFTLHDRNGDTVALVKVVSKRFFGETEKTSLYRGLQMAKLMEARFTDGAQLTE